MRWEIAALFCLGLATCGMSGEPVNAEHSSVKVASFLQGIKHLVMHNDL